jgi:hypothetical protein
VTDPSAGLLAAKEQDLRLRAIVLLDWRDGPIEGIAEIIDVQAYWLFQLFAERVSSEDLDDRVYLFSPISHDVAAPIRKFDQVSANRPLVWPFEDDPSPLAIRGAVDKAVASAQPALMLIRSVDFRKVQGIWRLTTANPKLVQLRPDHR